MKSGEQVGAVTLSSRGGLAHQVRGNRRASVLVRRVLGRMDGLSTLLEGIYALLLLAPLPLRLRLG